MHSIAYFGVLAARSRWRAEVVRDRGRAAGAEGLMGRGQTAVPEEVARPKAAVEPGELRERRLRWAELMRRVFEVDELRCPGCGDRRQLLAVITEPEVIAAFLASLGLPTRAPPLAPARELDPGEASLF